VAHTYNPCYSGGRDQEDNGLKPAWANSSRDSISKKKTFTKASGVAQGVGPQFKPQYCKRKGRKEKEGGREGGRKEEGGKDSKETMKAHTLS
jgi:hypothetical protein